MIKRNYGKLEVKLKKKKNIINNLYYLDNNSGIAKKRKDYEYNIQRHGKSKEDYLKYIQYEMSFLKLVQQRREVYKQFALFID